MSSYPGADRLILACRMVAAAWALIALFFLMLFVGLAGLAGGEGWGRATIGVLVLFCAIMPLELWIAAGLRCPACRRRVLLETFGPFHPAARVFDLGGRYAAVVLDVLRLRRFTCMYCGSVCRVGTPAIHPAKAGDS